MTQFEANMTEFEANMTTELAMDTAEDVEVVPVLCPTPMRLDPSYTRDYILIANFVTMALIPLILLTTLNFKLFQTIKVPAILAHCNAL